MNKNIHDTDENEDLEELALMEGLSNLAADLLSMEKYEHAVIRLLEQSPGKWQKLASIISNEPNLRERLAAIETEPGLVANVAWLEYPDDLDGYCVITFFCTLTLWSYSAVYNRFRLFREHGLES